MTLDTTYGKLKKRIFDLLYEYSSESDAVFVADDDRSLTEQKIPDAVNSALVRMYESLSVGRASVIQRINNKKARFYHKGVPDGEKNKIDFFAPSSSIEIFFRYFGGGSATIYDEQDTVVARITCAATESLTQIKKLLPLASSGTYKIGVSGNLKILDFCVYESDNLVSVNGICAADEVSFELPPDFERFESITVEGRKLDTDSVYTFEGYGFIKKSECMSCERIRLEYTKKAEFVSGDTDESYCFELPALAFEALVCLCAAELCRGENSAMHTRLIYKYNDLCEGLREKPAERKDRNTFYKASRKMRW